MTRQVSVNPSASRMAWWRERTVAYSASVSAYRFESGKVVQRALILNTLREEGERMGFWVRGGPFSVSSRGRAGVRVGPVSYTTGGRRGGSESNAAYLLVLFLVICLVVGLVIGTV